MKSSFQFIFIVIVVFCFGACEKENADPARNHVYENFTCEKAEEDQASVLPDLANYIYPISGAAPNLDASELSAMGEELKDAYFVGLGEATHGTREFFQMKDRIFRYLVENHGFKVMGFEATWGGALHVNQYVLHGIGSAKESVRRMKFWTWRTEEVVELVEWMRTYNLDKAEEDKLHFYGFDMQSTDEEYFWINDYLEKIDTELQAQINELIEDFVEKVNFRSYPTFAPSIQQAYRQNLEEAKQLYESKKEDLIAQSSQSEYDLIHHAFEILLQAEDNFDRNSGNDRDYYMARNSEWIRSYLGNAPKVALWAHNAHVSKDNTWLSFAQGQDLYQNHGDNYKVVGFSFSRGSFQAINFDLNILTTNNFVEETGCGTSNTLLQKIETSNYYIIFDELPTNSPSANYFNTKQPFFMLGAGFNPSSIRSVDTVLPDNYDILIHFDESTAAVPYE